MDDICKNTELFVHILGMSRTSAVQQWDEKALKRAFRWAAYFEQVHKKCRAKKNASEKITSYLEKVCSQPDVKLGVASLQFKDLSRASTILRKNLLENPYLSNEIYIELVTQCRGDDQSEAAFKSQLQSLSTLKATLEVLQMIQGRFESLTPNDSEQKEDSQESLNQQDSVNDKSLSQVTANAHLLRKCLANIFKQENVEPEKLRELHAKLANMIKHERGVDVLLSVLLVDSRQSNFEIDERITNYVTDFIHEILVPAWMNNWKYFLQLSVSRLLSKCSSRYPRFLLIHTDLMRHCCQELQSYIDKKNLDLSMKGMRESQSEEEMHKYYYFLIQKFFQALIQVDGACETSVESMIREEYDKIPKSLPTEKNIWKQLSHDLMVSTAI